MPDQHNQDPVALSQWLEVLRKMRAAGAPMEPVSSPRAPVATIGPNTGLNRLSKTLPDKEPLSSGSYLDFLERLPGVKMAMEMAADPSNATLANLPAGAAKALPEIAAKAYEHVRDMPGFYSRVTDAAAKMPKGMNAQGVLNYLQKNSAKEELALRQIPEFLASHDPKLPVDPAALMT